MKQWLSVKKQQGAVLVMALVLLTVLTLIGVTSMSSSTLEMKVASNMQQFDIAYQAAQSIIDTATWVNDPKNTNSYVTFNPVIGSAGYEQNMVYTSDDLKGVATGVTTWIGCGPAAGGSLEQGRGPVYNYFNMRATGMTSTNSSSSVQLQGLRYFAASCPQI